MTSGVKSWMKYVLVNNFYTEIEYCPRFVFKKSSGYDMRWIFIILKLTIKNYQLCDTILWRFKSTEIIEKKINETKLFHFIKNFFPEMKILKILVSWQRKLDLD